MPNISADFCDYSQFQLQYNNLKTCNGKCGTKLLLFIDADNLKLTNDTHGHCVGDLLIAEIGKILIESLPSDAVVCRKGGDEFIACVAVEDLEAAQDLAQGIGCMLNRRSWIGSSELSLSCSVGAAVSDGINSNLQNHIKQADTAMYWAKNEGKGQMRFYDQDACIDVLITRELIADFPSNLIDGALSFCFQPIYHIASRKVIGAEALIRWHHPKHGSISPKTIIDIALKCGRMLDLGLFILKEACTQASHWPSDEFVSINFSAVDFTHVDFANSVLEVIQSIGFEAGRLKIEITEDERLEQKEEVLLNIEALRQQGVTIGIDDFGAGHASMATIDNFSLDFVKIDRSLIANCNHRASSKVFINAIKKVSEILQLEVVAEGVETLTEAAVLRGMGVQYAQGYYFSRPVSPSKMLELITQPSRDYYLSNWGFAD